MVGKGWIGRYATQERGRCKGKYEKFQRQGQSNGKTLNETNKPAHYRMGRKGFVHGLYPIEGRNDDEFEVLRSYSNEEKFLICFMVL